ENYVLAHGIRGRQWLEPEPWRYKSRYSLEEDLDPETSDEELEIINTIRQQASRHLLAFYRSVKNGQPLTARRLSAALFELLLQLEVPQQLEEWRRQATATGDLDAAQEHEQVWDGLIELLDELVAALEDAPIEPAEYYAVLDSGLDSLKLRLIPPALDQVVVGSLDRSRQPELEAALLLGVGEGLLPARLPEDATFNDREREELQAAGVELAPQGSVQLFHEEFLAYLALTRSRRFLWLSYPLADSEGKALAPSPLIRRLRQLLPQLQEESVGLELPGSEADLQFLATPRQAAGWLAGILGRGRPLSPLWQEVLTWLCNDRERERWLAYLGGIHYRNQVEPLAPDSVARLYPQPLRCSISQLETYARCPFRFFLAYGLRLKERRLYQVDAASMGQFYHAALKLFVEELRSSGTDWGDIDADEASAIIKRVVSDLAPSLQHEIFSSSARYAYLLRKLEQTLQRAIAALSEHARRGQFRPLAVEARFGQQGQLPALVLAAGSKGQLFLEGQVDRIDVAEYQGKKYLRVIDYKSSPLDLKLEDIYYGLSLQLPLYLLAALSAAPALLGTSAEPAGLLYFAVRNPYLRQKEPLTDATEIEKRRRRELKMRGLLLAEPEIIKLMDAEVISEPDLLPVQLNKDGSLRKNAPAVNRQQMQALLNLAQQRAADLARSILSGRVQISPYYRGRDTGCNFCPYRAVCSFDRQIPGVTYRHLKAIKGDFWQLVPAALKKEDD
ncbi:MAG: helicase-exonuclease AddAB subunit AddB, partial [Clostridia bacterium]|nr:helicase-exonuclease AddAB subunit AddB [Clostridia bacterium]